MGMGMMWDDGMRETNRLDDDDGLVEGGFLRRPWAIFGRRIWGFGRGFGGWLIGMGGGGWSWEWIDRVEALG